MDKSGELKFVNYLGIYLGDMLEEIIGNFFFGNFLKFLFEISMKVLVSDYEYIVRDVNVDMLSCFNVDLIWFYEVSGCVGKIVVFVVCLDIFEVFNEE